MQSAESVRAQNPCGSADGECRVQKCRIRESAEFVQSAGLVMGSAEVQSAERSDPRERISDQLLVVFGGFISV